MCPLAHWQKHFDFGRFEANLFEASQRAFSAVQHDHPNETFYAFALYKSPLLQSIVPTSNSEEGLERVRAKYKHNYAARGRKYDDYRHKALRWETPADWFYHLYNREAFDPVNSQLLETGYLGDVLEFDDFLQLLSYAHDIMCRALTRLDSEGLFGTGAQRNRVIINVVMSDEGPLLENVQRLNPPDAIAWYKADLDKLYPPHQPLLARLTHRT